MSEVFSVMRHADLAIAHNLPVLNPTLYEALQRRFSDVVIAKAGTPLVGGAYVEDASGSRKFRATDDGEYYRVCCPFCQESRHRLWINHRWGVGLDETHYAYDPSDKFWWDCICFNSDCMSNPENVATLRRWTYGGIGRELHGAKIQITTGCSAPATLSVVKLPGTCIRIDQLSPFHTGRGYLEGRGYDIDMLGRVYDVHYCEEAPAEYPVVNGRIIIPIYMRGEMVGWQARAPYDCEWKAMGRSKYYNLPNMPRSLMLYGYDQAVMSPLCIVTEGVTNVWTIGDGAVATFGKSMSYMQAELIVTNWKHVVVAYDGGTEEQKATSQVEAMLAGKVQTLIPLALPVGEDPASLGATRFWDLVWAAAEERKIDLENLDA